MHYPGDLHPLLGGSWVVISRVTSPLIGHITIVTLLISPLITTHEPPSNDPTEPYEHWHFFLVARLHSQPQASRTGFSNRSW